MPNPINLPVNGNTERVGFGTYPNNEQVPMQVAGGALAVKAVSPTVSFEETEDGVIVTITDVDGVHSALIRKGEKGDPGEPGKPGSPGQPGVSPTASVTQTATGATVTVTDASGTTKANLTNGKDGEPGQDGYSPTASVSKSGDTATITITDKNGTTTAQVEDGQDGQDGVSPTITVTDITGGHRITITDATGAHSFDVMDGQDGTGAVQDVQIAGASIVQDGVANVPYAGKVPGVIKTYVNGNGFYGTSVDDTGLLKIMQSAPAHIKGGSGEYQPITPNTQHLSVFYGLAKIAGDTTQPLLPVATAGNYTESAKSAISEMLNGSVSVSGTTPSINALPGVRYVCGEVSTIDINTPEAGIVDVVFKSGSTPAVLTVTPPTGMTMQWSNGFDPSALEADTTYEINIMDGCLGVARTWS